MPTNSLDVDLGAEDAGRKDAGSAPAAQDEIAPFEFLLLVLARKKLIGQVTGIALVLAVVVSFLLPKWYTATTKILPPQHNQSLASSLLGQLGGQLGALASMGVTQGLGISNSNAVYVSMLQSRTVEDAIIRRFELQKVYRAKRMSDARKELEELSTIKLGAKDNVITISVQDKDPKRAADIANSYVDELRRLTKTLAITEAAQRRLFFEEQLEQAKDRLADAEQSLVTTQHRTGLIQLDSQARAIIDAVVRLKSAIAVKEVQLRAMRSFAADQNPDLLRTEQELAAMRSQLGEMQRKSGGVGGGDDVQIPISNVPEAGLEYVRKLRDVKYYEAIFELLAKQFEAAKLDEARSAAVVQALDVALEPDRKSSPKRALIIILVGLLALFGSIGYVFVDEKSGCELRSRISALRQAVFAR